MGDGDHIARRTGIITISDFRQKHLAGGGEGAPLALYGDYFLFSNDQEDRFLLNIGGIGNFTYLPANGHASDVFATDTGPGNTLMDAYARRLFEVDYDADGAQAAAGVVDQGLLEIFKSDPFFQLPFPKTTGPEQFSPAWADAVFAQHPKGQLNPFNQMATLNRLSAETIADALLRVQGTGAPKALYLSGGGAGNQTLVQHLKQLLPDWKIRPMRELGIPGDAKEAVLFAVLANETLIGSAEPDLRLGGIPYLSMGKISLPG
jgi:anhydro-N-acetylmuramic acid kinase